MEQVFFAEKMYKHELFHCSLKKKVICCFNIEYKLKRNLMNAYCFTTALIFKALLRSTSGANCFR